VTLGPKWLGATAPRRLNSIGGRRSTRVVAQHAGFTRHPPIRRDCCHASAMRARFGIALKSTGYPGLRTERCRRRHPTQGTAPSQKIMEHRQKTAALGLTFREGRERRALMRTRFSFLLILFTIGCCYVGVQAGARADTIISVTGEIKGLSSFIGGSSFSVLATSWSSTQAYDNVQISVSIGSLDPRFASGTAFLSVRLRIA
jgi:hypothetical protein